MAKLFEVACPCCQATLKIDPETAEVTWIFAETLEPYGINPDLPEECRQIGREYFARDPGSDPAAAPAFPAAR